MEELPNETNAVFMDVVRKKMETQDRQIADMEEKMGNPAISPIEIDHIKKSLLEIKTGIQNINFPQKEMQELSANLTTGVRLLKHPVENKIQHHHHVPKLLWISAGLFVALAIVCAGWYNTGNKLDYLVANDTKYRYLKLDTAQKALQLYLDKVDELYKSQSDMRKVVLTTEEEYRENFDRLKKAERLKFEAKTLEKAARKK